MPKNALNSMLAPAMAGLLIAGAFVQGLMQPSPADAEGYHRAIASAMADTPMDAGPWEGQDVEIPDGALQLLRPNVARSRVYTREADNARAQFLLIQCKDARDLAGHYPPNCYPQVYGYILTQDVATDWSIDGLTVHGRTYTFRASDQPQADTIHVQQFFILPNGTTTDAVQAIYRLAGDYTQRHRGAAQVQVVYPANDVYRDAERNEIFEQIVGSYADVIRLIQSGQPAGS